MARSLAMRVAGTASCRGSGTRIAIPRMAFARIASNITTASLRGAPRPHRIPLCSSEATMADNDRTLEPVDALKTERADSSYEFPTSESMATDGHSEPSAKSDDHGFREASQSLDGGSNGASSGDLRSSAKNKFADMQDAMSRKYRVA